MIQTLSLLEHVEAGQELVVKSSMVGATRPVLELLGVTWDTDGDSSNNSFVNPTTGVVKVLSSHTQHIHMHMHMHMHMHIHINIINP